MNKRQRPARKRKGATAAVVVCFVAAIAIVGTYTFRDYRKTQQEQQLAQAEETNETKEEKTEEPTETANNDLVINTTENDDKQNTDEDSGDTADGAAANENQNTQATAGSGTSVHFTEDSQEHPVFKEFPGCFYISAFILLLPLGTPPSRPRAAALNNNTPGSAPRPNQ